VLVSSPRDRGQRSRSTRRTARREFRFNYRDRGYRSRTLIASTSVYFAGWFQSSRPRTAIATFDGIVVGDNLLLFQTLATANSDRDHGWSYESMYLPLFQPSRPQTAIVIDSWGQSALDVLAFQPWRPQTAFALEVTHDDYIRTWEFQPSRPQTAIANRTNGGHDSGALGPRSAIVWDGCFNPRDHKQRARSDAATHIGAFVTSDPCTSHSLAFNRFNSRFRPLASVSRTRGVVSILATARSVRDEPVLVGAAPLSAVSILANATTDIVRDVPDERVFQFSRPRSSPRCARHGSRFNSRDFPQRS